MAKVDSGNDGVPYESPSTKSLQCDGACLEDGTAITLTLEQALSCLKSAGITPLAVYHHTQEGYREAAQ